MSGKGGRGNSPDAVYVVLERSVAIDLLNALYIAVGVIPDHVKKSGEGGKEAEGGTGGKSGGGAKTGGASGKGKGK
ncbi:MAG TPA: hypothetical protein VNH22_11600, partial [Blastocatellia bacterium]|jgi:hypothetical protein|nr:hypothetical protein [Blastocatellia bacterium]